MRLRRVLLGGVLPLLGALACADGQQGEEGPAADAGLDAAEDVAGEVVEDDVTVGADAGADEGGGGACTEGRIITTVIGSVVDETGAPVEGARPQACLRQQSGALICLRPTSTAADGSFAQSVPFDAQCVVAFTFRIAQPASHRATMYCGAVLPERSPVLAAAAPFVLHPTRPPEVLPAGDEDTEQKFIFEGGVELDVAPSALYFPAGGWADLSMGAVAVDAPGLCFLEGEAPLDGLFAFSPEADVRGGAARVRLPNVHGLPAGAEVDLFVLGGLDCTLAGGERVEEGHWQRFGSGEVSADGSVIASGQEVPCLTWLGYRRVEP